MRRYTNILFVPLGEHENRLAVLNIRRLVLGTDARLTLFGVIPSPGMLRQLLPVVDLEREVRQRELDRLEASLRVWAASIGDASVETAVETGPPARAIVAKVATGGHDLVVVTSDDDRRDRTTIRRLLRTCPCPVWVIRPTRARTLRVLAAVNPEPGEEGVNRLVLELAASMVALHGGELSVVHAWELYGEATLRSPGFVHSSAAEVDELVRRELAGRRQALDALLAQPTVAAAPWRVHLEKGAPVDVIPDLADRLRINLLVMGTAGRSGISGIVMGNTAEHVLDRVSCSVIAVKPPTD